MSCPNNVFFFSYVFGLGLNPGPHDAFGCQFDLVFFNLKLFLPFIFLSWPWFFLEEEVKVQGNDFVEYPSVLVDLMFAYIELGYMFLDRI